MEYLAFILFGFGILLVVAGLMLQQNEKSTINRFSQQPPQPAPVNPSENRQPYTGGPEQHRSTRPRTELHFTEHKPRIDYTEDEFSKPSPSATVAVHVAEENPNLFSREAHMYLDHNRDNIYSGEQTSFKMQDLTGIRRFGRGRFQYDGFTFRFEHPTGIEKFPLEQLDHLAFYPNCIVLVPKNDLPSALVFLDETESIRRVLETFRVEHDG